MKFIDSVMCNFTGDGGLHNLVLDELMGASGIAEMSLMKQKLYQNNLWTTDYRV